MHKYRLIQKLSVTVIVILLVLVLLKRKEMTWRQSILKTFYPIIMLPGKLFGKASGALQNKNHMQPTVSFYQLQVTLNNGTVVSMDSFKGKSINS